MSAIRSQRLEAARRLGPKPCPPQPTLCRRSVAEYRYPIANIRAPALGRTIMSTIRTARNVSFGIQETPSCRSSRSVAWRLFRVRSCNGVIRRSTNRCYLAVSLVLIIDFGAGKGTRVSFRLARKARTLARSAPLRIPPNAILLPGTTREGRAIY